MLSAMWAFVVAALVTLFLTPAVRRLAVRWNAVDRPGGRRVNLHVIPRLGGIGIAIAFYAALAFIFLADTAVAQRFFASYSPTVGLLVGGLLMCCVGILDDTRGLRARHKLLAQLVAAGVAYATGFRIEALNLPFVPFLELGAMSPVVTAVWVVAVINAINLIDGLDGLAGGVTFFACAANFVVAALGNDPHLMLLSATLGGAVFGFLFFNFNPASIFMGDSGSLFLGYILATTSIHTASVKSTTAVSILVPFIALGLPLMDTMLAIVRRILRRQSIFSPDRGHIHHLLLSLGFTHRRAVVTLYAFCVFLTAGAVAMAFARQRHVGLTMLVLALVSMGVVAATGVIVQAVNRYRTREFGWSAAVDSLRLSVPPVLLELGQVDDLDGMVRVMGRLLERTPVRSIELLGSADEALTAACQLRRDVVPPAADVQHLVTTYLALPAAGTDAQLLFKWTNDEPALSAEASILLQLVADALNAALTRTGVPQVDSELAPPVPQKTTIRSELRTGALLPTGPAMLEAHGAGRISKP